MFAGQVASYRLRLRNAGRNPAIGVRVRTAIPPGFSLLGTSAHGAVSAGGIGFRMAILVPGRARR